MKPPGSLPEPSASWARADWRGEPAWTSVHGEVRATVSESRSRLIYLGALDGSLNLLNAPWPQVLPGKDDPCPNQGGHRFWLGPQHRWVWPPPTEWEFAASQAASVNGAVLVLHQARLDPQYPSLIREYAWEDRRLRCTVRWADNGRRYFGLHVVAVDTPLETRVRLGKSAAAPEGVVAARMVDPEPPIRLPHPALAIHDGFPIVRSGIQRAKLGFVPQTLVVDRAGGWQLAVEPGPYAEADGESPDHGLLSQVWVGEAGCELAELEQLTPHLRGDPTGQCFSTIFIRATPPARPNLIPA